MTNYNKLLYGDPICSPQETIDRLKKEGCFHEGILRVYPEWFNAAELFEAIRAGLLCSVNYPELSNHTELMLKEN